ncbi:CAAX prenyl protease 2 [Myriangium duriaei CBS 260.36]|uniref:intramembrane prenyl-peptidase Rce1 n=1 Tax=Myriangium duriaei CBS 260.36 TaxID=1168546 RepID=A0A9P4J5A8_9PEZI|nr:CAAX prenyl protease 2 [Myriangium duriaei CBS 260.36]
MHEPQDGQPPISRPVALLISISFAIAYVAPFYLSKALRISHRVSRDSSESIRARCRAVYICCVLCFAVTINVHSVIGMATPAEFLRRMGFFPVALYDMVKSMLLVCILFVGPLFEQGIVEGNWRYWRWQTIRDDIYHDWMGWRNFVVGPVSEEFIWRSLSISLLLSAWTPGPRIVVQAPLLFGVAHLHHLNEFIITHKRHDQSYFSAVVTPRIIVPGLVRTLFQLGYTTLFGMFATFVFLRTGNVWSCILAHVFCNWMGLPRVWGRLGESVAAEAVQISQTQRKRFNENEQDRPSRADIPTIVSASTSYSLGIQWTVAYYVLLVSGAWGFYKLLYPLTESNNKLTSI